MLILSFAAALSLASPQQAPAAAAPADELDKVVCRREEVIGSKVQKRRVCMTERERRRLEQGTRDGMDDYIRKATSGSSPG